MILHRPVRRYEWMTTEQKLTQLRFRIGGRALRIPALLWIGIGIVAAVSPEFPARRLAIIFAFGFGVVLWLLTRPTRVLLDATDNSLRIRAPRLPFGTTTITVPLDDVIALDIETLPRAWRGDTVTFDAYRLSWRLRSGKQIPIKRGSLVVGAYDKQRAAVNAFLKERV